MKNKYKILHPEKPIRVRRSPKQITHIIRRIQEMTSRKMTVADQLKELKNVSRMNFFRYKKKGKSLKPLKGDVGRGLNWKPLNIDKTLDPVQFCDKYLSAKPNIAQRVIIKAFYGLEFLPAEKKILDEWKRKNLTTWEPDRKYKELVLLAGMKGGKTTVAAFFAAIEEYILFKIGDVEKHYGFTPGKETWILNVATDKDQARDTIFAAIKALIDRSPYFKTRNPKEIGDSFIFEDTNVRIKSGHSNSASLVGRNIKAALPDELDRFKTKGGKYSADAVYNGLNRSTDPFRDDGHIFSISSLVNERGIMVNLYQKSKKIPTMLGFWLPEWEMQRERYKMYSEGATDKDSFVFMGVKIPIEHKNEFDKDTEGFLRDKACMVGYTRGKYYRMPYKIDTCFENANNEGHKNPLKDDGTFEPWFRQKDEFKYFIHGDASFNHDAYGLALGHRDDELVVIDLAHRFLPPSQYGEIDLEEVKKFILLLFELFPSIDEFTYDTWAAAELKQTLEKIGINTNHLYIKKPQHDLLKEKIYKGTLKCYHSKQLISELKGLELHGDKVDHPVDGSSDMENAVAGVLWNCTGKDSGVSAAIAVGGADSRDNEEVSKAGFKRLPHKGRKRIWD